jgi:hypothetical protein
MNRPLGEIDSRTFLGYAAIYNVRWILTSTSDCRENVGRLIGDLPLWESRHFSLWEIESPGRRLEDQGIEISASYGMIEVKLQADGEGRLPSSVVLPYHWDRGLRVDPPAGISRLQQMDDPVPFILLEPNGESEIRIEYR